VTAKPKKRERWECNWLEMEMDVIKVDKNFLFFFIFIVFGVIWVSLSALEGGEVVWHANRKPS